MKYLTEYIEYRILQGHLKHVLMYDSVPVLRIKAMIDYSYKVVGYLFVLE